jgi:hypothetical protein
MLVDSALLRSSHRLDILCVGAIFGSKAQEDGVVALPVAFVKRWWCDFEVEE